MWLSYQEHVNLIWVRSLHRGLVSNMTEEIIRYLSIRNLRMAMLNTAKFVNYFGSGKRQGESQVHLNIISHESWRIWTFDWLLHLIFSISIPKSCVISQVHNYLNIMMHSNFWLTSISYFQDTNQNLVWFYLLIERRPLI